MKTFDRLEQLEADKLYVSGMTSKEIANLANVNPTSVDDYLKKKGGKYNGKSSDRRTYAYSNE